MALLLLLPGLMLMALCLYRIYASLQRKGAWVKAPGRIMSLGLRQSGTKRNGRPRMGELYCISYRAKNGRPHTLQIKDLVGARQPNGDVEVLYNPANPDQAVPNTGRDLVGVWLALLLMSAYMVFFGGYLLLHSGP
jgi:hypothetical protein